MTENGQPKSSERSRRSLVKRLLRLMPRRARLHTYPVIGRFALHLRRHQCLWSFRRKDVRRSYYGGAMLAFLPLMGVQLPLAAVAALVLRSNIMVMGGLQFVTNPVTAAPIYFGTHQIGEFVLGQLGHHPRSKPRESELVDVAGIVGDTLVEERATPVKFSKRLRHVLESLTIGGVLTGLAVGGCLDLIDALVRPRATGVATGRHHPPNHPHHGAKPRTPRSNDRRD